MKMTPNRWGALAFGTLALGMLASALLPQTAITRPYWPTSIETMFAGAQKHTHAAVTGRVAYCRTEDDGDRHIRLESELDTSKFIIAEIIPLIPLACPKAGTLITARGITRYDPEHGWREIHPVESWSSP
jgi:hypothetical protein